MTIVAKPAKIANQIAIQTKSVGSKNGQKKCFNFVPAPDLSVQGKVWKWSQWDFWNE